MTVTDNGKVSAGCTPLELNVRGGGLLGLGHRLCRQIRARVTVIQVLISMREQREISGEEEEEE